MESKSIIHQQSSATHRLLRTAQRLAIMQTLHVVCWGDSISEVGRSLKWHGGASSPERNWGSLLQVNLQLRFADCKIHVRHAGIGGQNAYEGLGRLDALWPLSPDLVLIEFGTNDCCHHRLEPEQTACALDEMISRIHAAGIDVIVLGTAGNHPADPAFHHVESTVSATKAVADRHGVPFVNLRALMLKATENGEKWGEYHLADRNCHPNDAGHQLWANAVLQTILEALPEERTAIHRSSSAID